MKKDILLIVFCLMWNLNLSAQSKPGKNGSPAKNNENKSVSTEQVKPAADQKRLSKSAYVMANGEEKQFELPLFIAIPNLDEAGGDLSKLEEIVQAFVKESGNQIHSNAFSIKKVNNFVVLVPEGKENAKPAAWKAACSAVSKNFGASAFSSLEEFADSFPFDNYGLSKDQTESFVKEMLSISK